MIEVRMPEAFRPLDQPYRYKVVYGGRGATKSWTFARKLLLKGVQKPLRILCTRELQKSIKQSVHKLLCDQIAAMGLSGFYSVTETSIKGLNGTEFLFMGVKHNPEEIKSTEGIDICWIEEAANLTESSWDIIDPTIRKDDSEIWISFNTRFKFDHIYQLFIANEPPPGSWVKKVNHSDVPKYFPEVLRRQMEHMRSVDYEKYLHIWEGELKQLAEGAIFKDQILRAKQNGQFCRIPIESSIPVHTFWDLGKNDHCAIWFMQEVGKEYRMIDYYENRLKDIDHYCRVIKGQCRNEGVSDAENGRRANYLYGDHHMPHDVNVELLGMKKNRKKQFEEGGVKPVKVVPRISLKQQAIELARQVFPRVWFDEQRCAKGIDALSNYRYEYNDDRDAYNQNPHHDWASNGADAFMQMAQGYVSGPSFFDDDIDYPEISVA